MLIYLIRHTISLLKRIKLYIKDKWSLEDVPRQQRRSKDCPWHQSGSLGTERTERLRQFDVPVPTHSPTYICLYSTRPTLRYVFFSHIKAIINFSINSELYCHKQRNITTNKYYVYCYLFASTEITKYLLIRYSTVRTSGR